MLSGMVSGALAGAALFMSGNPMFCFVAGTSVLTVSGKKAIETIQVGDVVPCFDHITGEETEKRVISTTVNKVDRLIELEIDGENICCTETHPFQVQNRGWVNASDLRSGDVVYTKDWNTATVNRVNLIELDEPIEVFNFEVEDCHTYFVGDIFLVVHNGTCGSRFYKATRTDTGIQRGAEITRKQALQQIRAGKDVLTTSRASAKRLVKDAFGNAKAYKDIHIKIPNAMTHFHDAAHHFFHVFFT